MVLLLTTLLSGGIATHRPTPEGPKRVPEVLASEGAGGYPRSGHPGEAAATLMGASEGQEGASDPPIPAVSGEVSDHDCFATELDETCYGCATENANVHCYACSVPICHACSHSHIYQNDCFLCSSCSTDFGHRGCYERHSHEREYDDLMSEHQLQVWKP